MTAAESVNEEAVEAVARAICPGTYCEAHSECRDDARAALAAALPLLRPSDVPHLERRIRESIAGEIEAAHGNFSRESCQAFGGYSVGHFDGLDGAARIARGGSS